jgi:hypothetical protein
LKTELGTIAGKVNSFELPSIKNIPSSIYLQYGIHQERRRVTYQQYEEFTISKFSGEFIKLFYDFNSGYYELKDSSDLLRNIKMPIVAREQVILVAIQILQEYGDKYKDFNVMLAKMLSFDTLYSIRFDEGLDLFNLLTAKYDASNLSSPLIEIGFHNHSSQLLAFRGFSIVSQTRVNWPDYLTEDSSEIKFKPNDLPLLQKFIEQTTFVDASLRYEIIQRKSGEQSILIFGNPSFEFFKVDGSSVNHSLLSYGQKRLLAFISYIENNPKFIIADELVNGLHHEWIDFCVESFEHRQNFLASQNPLLLDYLYFYSPEDAASSFVLCTINTENSSEILNWQQMNENESIDFYKSYNTGLLHVSEVLKNKGLW